MLYCEFLEGTGAPENAYSWAEYKRIEKIYNADDTMEKRDAYALYQKPDELTEALMKENNMLRDQNRKLHEEKAELREQIKEMNFIMEHMRQEYFEITFDTKKGYPKSWIINIGASNRKEAIEKVKCLWMKDSRLNEMHMFHIKARKLKDTEEFLYNYFAIVGK